MILYQHNLRLDRALSLYLFGPLQRSRSGDRPSLSILMYHSIARMEDSRSHPYYCLTTPPEVFAGHMKFLHDHGYSVVSLGEAVTRYADENNKYVVLTFDDGFFDFYTEAFPVLRNYGFAATVFLPTGYINDRRQRLCGRRHLDWEQIGLLHEQGVHFGSHTVTHSKITALNDAELAIELGQSKETLERRLGVAIESFSCPFAFPEGNRQVSGRLRVLLQKYGYSYGVSTRIGTVIPGDDHYSLKRLPINGYDDTRLFKAKLDGDYDWLHGVQRLYKKIMQP